MKLKQQQKRSKKRAVPAMAAQARLFPTRSSRCLGSSDWRIGMSKRAICCNAAMCAVLNAEAREESTSTTPRTEPCAWTGTTTAERSRKLFAASLTRESSSVCLHRSSPVRSQSILSSGWFQGGAVNQRQELLPHWLDKRLPKCHAEQWQRRRHPSANEPALLPLLRR